jgi:hypothetical protein
MKIRLLENIPVEEKHGMKKGRVFEVKMTVNDGWRIKGKAGKDVKIWFNEAEVIVEKE